MRTTRSREDETAFANVTCQQHNFWNAATGSTNLHFSSKAEVFQNNAENFSWKKFIQLCKLVFK